MKTKVIYLSLVLTFCLCSNFSQAQEHSDDAPWPFKSIDSATFEQKFFKLNISDEKIKNYQYSGAYPAIVYFYFDCGPVKRMNEVFSELYHDKPLWTILCDHYSVDLKKNQSFGKITRNAPHYLIFYPGKNIISNVGLQSYEKAKEMIEPIMYYDQNRFTVVESDIDGKFDVYFRDKIVSKRIVFRDSIGRFTIDQYYGAISPKGEIIFDFVFDKLGRFSEGLAFYRLKKNNSLGYINKKGEVIISWNSTDHTDMMIGDDFHCGMAKMRYGFNEEWYVNTKGEVLENDDWRRLYDFSEDLACVELESGGIAFIDKTGRYIIGPLRDWSYAEPFKNGKALISNGNSDYYYLYKNGKMIYDSTPDY